MRDKAALDSLVALANSRIVQVMRDEGIELKKQGASYAALCFAHEEKTPSLMVSEEKQCFNCLGCGASGNAVGFIMQHQKIEFLGAVDYLAGKFNVDVPEVIDNSPETKKKHRIFNINYSASNLFATQLNKSPGAKDYLKERNVTDRSVQMFNIGYASAGWSTCKDMLKHPEHELIEAGILVNNIEKIKVYDVFRDRIVFPIRNTQGNIIGFGGRDIAPKQKNSAFKPPKYINTSTTPAFKKEHELYGLFETLQFAQKTPIDRIVIVEGYMDVISMHQNNFTSTVAPNGTALTESQVKKAFRFTKHLVFMFDGDKAGRAAALKAAYVAMPHIIDNNHVSIAVLPEAMDPDLLLQKDKGLVTKALEESQSIIAFVIDHEISQMENTNAQSKAVVASAINTRFKHVDPFLLEHINLEVKQTLQELSQETLDGEKAFAAMLPGAQEIFNNSDDNIKSICGLVLKDPSWLKLVELDPHAFGHQNQDVLRLTMHIIENGEHHKWNDSLTYLSSLAPKSDAEKINLLGEVAKLRQSSTVELAP